MGINGSVVRDPAGTDLLKRLSSTEAINPMDPFWNQLLSFFTTTPISSTDSLQLEEETVTFVRSFAVNNRHTGNLSALVHNFLVRAEEMKVCSKLDENILIWQTRNSLFIIRCLCKYFVENLSEELILEHFSCRPHAEDGVVVGCSDDNGHGCLETFLGALIELLIGVPVLRFTYSLHLEALNTLLVLLSVQMFHAQPEKHFSLYHSLMHGNCSRHAPSLVKALLRNFVNQEVCPPELCRDTDRSGLLASVTSAAASLWSVVTLGLASKTVSERGGADGDGTLLANQSVLVLLVLTNHCTTDRGYGLNLCRDALLLFSDDGEQSSAVHGGGLFSLDYGKAYRAIGQTLDDERSTLLVYMLLHKNVSFRSFVLSRTDIDVLVFPLLRVLYQADDRNPHHIYMALIVVLVLTEDDLFNKFVHEIELRYVAWYKEHTLSRITLGGLLVLVLIRTIQFNITRMRDKYLHTNCLAALANMSSRFSNLHPFVAQKIVSLFSQLCKRHARLVDQIRRDSFDATAAVGMDHSDKVDDLEILEEVIRMVLEIINSCLTHSFHHNPHLIYTLLYHCNLFSVFRTNPAFQDVIQNVETVLSFFSAVLERRGHGHGGSGLSPDEVLRAIKESSVQFRLERLKKHPDLKFKYVEEETPEDFFVPYIWSLVYQYSNIPFDASRILHLSFSPSKVTEG